MAEFLLPRTEKDGKPIATRTKALLELSIFLNKLSPLRPWEIIVRPWKKARSDAQNHALFGVAYKVICAETGNKKQHVHEAMCIGFFGGKIVEVMGRRKQVPIRTTTTDEHGHRDVLAWDEFSNFYTHVESEAAGYGIKIPPPDPDWKIRAARLAAKAQENVT